MSYNNLIYTIKDRVNTISINRPKKLNALNNETFSEIYNFEKWMKTKTNLSESSVKKYVDSVRNLISLDFLR